METKGIAKHRRKRGVFMCDIIFNDVIGQYVHDNFGCCNRCCKLFNDSRAGYTLLIVIVINDS